MLDVLRNLFRPATPAQKLADLRFVESGGELLVSAMLVSAERRKGVHLRPQGTLHVTHDTAIWKGNRHLPELTFVKGDWIVRSTPSTGQSRQFDLVSLVKARDRNLHYEMRVPTPDVDLVKAVVSGPTVRDL